MARKRCSVIAVVPLVLICLFVTAGNSRVFAAGNGLAIKKTIFQSAEQVMLEADTEKTRLFAPKTFGEAMAYYQGAESDFNNEKTIKDINEKLDKSVVLFKKAIEISSDGAELLKDLYVARADAHKVMASKIKPKEWNSAEDMFKRAVSKLEKGARDDAIIMGEQARSMYRQVEKDTVIYGYMSEILDKLKKIDAMKEGEYFAPKTYRKAQELAKKAQAELEKQPFNNEEAKGIIKQALAQVDYGMKISDRIKAMVKDKKTFEDLFLESMIPMETKEKEKTVAF